MEVDKSNREDVKEIRLKCDYEHHCSGEGASHNEVSFGIYIAGKDIPRAVY